MGFMGFMGFFYPMRGKWQGHILPITYEGLGKTQKTNKTHNAKIRVLPLEGNIMAMIGRNDTQARPVRMPPQSDAELEAEALNWCERLSQKLTKKHSKSKTSRGSYDSRNR